MPENRLTDGGEAASLSLLQDFTPRKISGRGWADLRTTLQLEGGHQFEALLQRMYTALRRSTRMYCFVDS